MDILPFLLLPLAGPEDFSEEEMEREWLGRSLRVRWAEGDASGGGAGGGGEDAQGLTWLKPSSQGVAEHEWGLPRLGPA